MGIWMSKIPKKKNLAEPGPRVPGFSVFNSLPVILLRALEFFSFTFSGTFSFSSLPSSSACWHDAGYVLSYYQQWYRSFLRVFASVVVRVNLLVTWESRTKKKFLFFASVASSVVCFVKTNFRSQNIHLKDHVK